MGKAAAHLGSQVLRRAASAGAHAIAAKATLRSCFQGSAGVGFQAAGGVAGGTITALHEENLLFLAVGAGVNVRARIRLMGNRTCVMGNQSGDERTARKGGAAARGEKFGYGSGVKWVARGRTRGIPQPRV